MNDGADVYHQITTLQAIRHLDELRTMTASPLDNPPCPRCSFRGRPEAECRYWPRASTLRAIPVAANIWSLTNLTCHSTDVLVFNAVDSHLKATGFSTICHQIVS